MPSAAARTRSTSGILRSLPVAVAVPEDADDVAALMRWAAEHGIALVPRAAGTGMPGGNIGPGIAVDLKTRFGTIGPVDVERRTARSSRAPRWAT